MYDFFRITEIVKDVGLLDVQVGDVLTMKKQHPCGGKEFEILRAGMDFRIRCLNCDAQIWIPRVKLEKRIRKRSPARKQVRFCIETGTSGMTIEYGKTDAHATERGKFKRYNGK